MSEEAENEIMPRIKSDITESEVDRLERTLVELMKRLPRQIPEETGKLWLNGSDIALS